jgi:hypothetical protein
MRRYHQEKYSLYSINIHSNITQQSHNLNMGRPPNPHGRRGAEAAKKQFVVPIPPVEPRLQAMVER